MEIPMSPFSCPLLISGLAHQVMKKKSICLAWRSNLPLLHVDFGSLQYLGKMSNGCSWACPCYEPLRLGHMDPPNNEMKGANWCRPGLILDGINGANSCFTLDSNISWSFSGKDKFWKQMVFSAEYLLCQFMLPLLWPKIRMHRLLSNFILNVSIGGGLFPRGLLGILH